jgi:DNA topoisomerase VI subunit B
MAVLPKDAEQRLAIIAENRVLAGRLDLLANKEPIVTRKLLKAAAQALKEVKSSLSLQTITDFQKKRLQAQAKWLHLIREDIQSVLDDTLPSIRDDLIKVAQDEAVTLTEILSFEGQAASVNSVALTASQLTAISKVPVADTCLKIGCLT